MIRINELKLPLDEDERSFTGLPQKLLKSVKGIYES